MTTATIAPPTFKLFSTDDHLIEHPRVWQDRVPERFKDRAPRVIEADGAEFWTYEDERLPIVELTAAAHALRDKQHSNQAVPKPARFSEMLPSCYDPAERAKDLYAAGVGASVSFPTLPRYAGVRFLRFSDKELADHCVRAYNDYVLDEWCPGGPEGLYVPMIIAQLWDPALAAEEIRRCAAKGARAITLPDNTVPLGEPSYWTNHWDPVWQACQDTGMVICMHIGTSGQRYHPSPEAPNLIATVLSTGMGSQASIVNLLYSPTLHRFPELKFVFSESGLGWVPYVLERADMVWERYGRRDGTLESTIRPSDIFRRHMFVCAVEERAGVQAVHQIGAANVMWELDFPHPDTVWPFVQKETGEVFDAAGLQPDAIERITHLNAEEVFRWVPTYPEPQILG